MHEDLGGPSLQGLGRDSLQLGPARHLPKNVRPDRSGAVRREYGSALPPAEANAQDERNPHLDHDYPGASNVQESKQFRRDSPQQPDAHFVWSWESASGGGGARFVRRSCAALSSGSRS